MQEDFLTLKKKKESTVKNVAEAMFGPLGKKIKLKQTLLILQQTKSW